MFIKLLIVFMLSAFSSIGFSQEYQAIFVWGNVVVIKHKKNSYFVKVGQTIPSLALTVYKAERTSPSTVVVDIIDRGTLKQLKVSQPEKTTEAISKVEDAPNPEPSFTVVRQEKTSGLLRDGGKKFKKNRSLQEWRILQDLEADNILNISDLSEEELDQVLLEATDCSYQFRTLLATCIEKDKNEQ
jgi:hypothetical protein